MYAPFLMAAIVILFLLIVAQLIRMGSLVLALSKDKKLREAEQPENFEFIKGLY